MCELPLRLAQRRLLAIRDANAVSGASAQARRCLLHHTCLWLIYAAFNRSCVRRSLRASQFANRDARMETQFSLPVCTLCIAYARFSCICALAPRTPWLNLFTNLAFACTPICFPCCLTGLACSVMLLA